MRISCSVYVKFNVYSIIYCGWLGQYGVCHKRTVKLFKQWTKLSKLWTESFILPQGLKNSVECLKWSAAYFETKARSSFFIINLSQVCKRCLKQILNRVFWSWIFEKKNGYKKNYKKMVYTHSKIPKLLTVFQTPVFNSEIFQSIKIFFFSLPFSHFLMHCIAKSKFRYFYLGN